jgi:DNA uptake protein ComE-like DNA-binding protein
MCRRLAVACAASLIVTGAWGATDPAATTPGSSAAPAPASTSGAKPDTPVAPAASPKASGPPASTPPDKKAGSAAPAKSTAADKAPAKPVKKVDINNANLDELKTRLQVSDDVAKKIIEHRPYASKGELVTKAKLPEGIFQAVRRKVELQPPRKPAATK